MNSRSHYQSFGLQQQPYICILKYSAATVKKWDILHSHQGMEFLYVHGGSGTVTIGNTIRPFYPGTLMYFQPFQVHRVVVEDTASYVRTRIHFEPEQFLSAISGFPTLEQFYQYLWKDDIPNQIIHRPDRLAAFNHLMDGQLAPREDLPQERQLEDFGLFLSCFIRLVYESWEFTPREIAFSKSRVFHQAEKAREWIEAHFREDFQLSRMANDLFITPSHLSSLFRKTTGCTITEYILARRIREACTLLHQDERSIKDISHDLGFSKTSYFCSVFKARIGCTPLQYRRKPPLI